MPCWAGITPGVTRSTEAATILAERYGDEAVFAQDGESFGWVSSSTDASSRGAVLSSDGTVSRIEVGFEAEQYLLEDLFAQIGEPDSVGLRYGGVNELGEIACLYAHLLYTDIHVVVGTYPHQESARGGFYHHTR